MTKKITTFFITILATIFSLFSYGFSISDPENKLSHHNIIPKETNLLITFDTESLAQKSEFNLDDNAKELISNLIKSFTPEKVDPFVDSLLMHPQEMGIDPKAPTTFFVTKTLGNAKVFLFKLSDRSKLEKAITRLKKGKIIPNIVDTNANFSYSITGDCSIVYNNDVLLLIGKLLPVEPAISYEELYGDDEEFAELIEEERQTKKEREAEQLEFEKAVVALINEKRATSVFDNIDYQKMRTFGGELQFYVNQNILPELGIVSKEQLDEMAKLNNNVSAENMAYCGMAACNNGNINIKYAVNYPESKLDSVIHFYHQYCNPINADFLKKFPSTSPAVFSVNMDLGYVIKTEKVQQMLLKSMNLDDIAFVERLFSSINGEICLGMLNGKDIIPEFLGYLTITDKAPFHEMVSCPETTKLIKTRGKDKYSFDIKGHTIYFGLVNDQIYITNSKKFNANIGADVTPKLSSTPLDLDVADQSVYFYCNVEELLNIKSLRLLMKEKDGEAFYTKFSKIEGNVDHKTLSGELSIGFKDKNQNSLKIIYDYLIKHTTK